MSEEPKIEFIDKRRIKSIDDTCNEDGEADLDRLPTFVEKLNEQLEGNDARLKEYIVAHKEKMAEMDLLRKRLEEDAERRASARFGELIRDLLPVIGDIDRALEHTGEEERESQLGVGVKMLRNGLLKSLEKRGLEVVDCVGEPFDPEIAQAVGTVPVEDDEKVDMVIEQMSTGYRFGGIILQPAMVRVGRKD